MAKKVIAVTGATGAQGGSLVRAILADPEQRFGVRAITRKPDSDKAKQLAGSGVEVVRADLDDVNSLREAFRNVHGVFCVTNFWEHYSPERETAQATNLAHASADAGVKHAIWSTLEDTRKYVPLSDDSMPTLNGKYKVPHFDGKGEADAEFEKRGVPTTYLLASFYWENYIHFGAGPQRTPDGKLALIVPMGDAPLAGIGVEDIGRSAFSIFAAGDEFIGRRVGIASDHLPMSTIAEEMSRATGQEIAYQDVPADVYRGFGFPGAEDLGNMFQFYRDFGDDVLSIRNVEETRRLSPRLQSFREWVGAHGSQIPIP